VISPKNYLSIVLIKTNEIMNPKLKAIIIEDHAIDVIVICHLIKNVSPDIEICGNAANIAQAVELIELHQPDIIFMDIELSDGSAFQVIEILQRKDTPIGALIFMSATQRYDYAVKGIEYACLSFMSKPLTERAVRDAIDKVKNQHTHRFEIETLLAHHQKKSNKILLPIIRHGREIVESDAINYFEAEGQCTNVHLIDGSFITALRILGHFKKLLSTETDPPFFLIHQSFLINVDQVKSFNLLKHSVIMKNDITLETSRRHGANFKNYWQEYDKKIISK
jgi:two-component system, LytTR family, response regulator